MKRLYGIRGATGVENSAKSISSNVAAMCNEIFSLNGVKADDIVSIQFTVTDDIDAMNPATALRQNSAAIDVSHCALFCAVEPKMANSLPCMIRVLVTAYMTESSDVHHVYINGAQELRRDLR